MESEASAVVECPTIATKVRDMIAAAVVQIDGKQDPVMIGAEFKNELFFSLDAEDAVRVSENVGTEADFQTVFVPLRLGPGRKTRALSFSKFHSAELTGSKSPLRPVFDHMIPRGSVRKVGR